MLLKQGLGLVLIAVIISSGCSKSADTANKEQQGLKLKVQPEMLGWEHPELIPEGARMQQAAPSSDGLATDATGSFKGDPKELADSIHESRLADGWTPGLVADQGGQYYMTYQKDGALVIYELARNQNQGVITISYLPSEATAS